MPVMLIKNKRIFNILDSESYMLGVVIEANRAEKNMLTIYVFVWQGYFLTQQ